MSDGLLSRLRIAIVARPLLVLGATNALTAFGALYMHAGSLTGIRRMIFRIAFKLVVGSARFLSPGTVSKEEAKIQEKITQEVVGEIKGHRYRSLPEVRSWKCRSKYLALSVQK